MARVKPMPIVPPATICLIGLGNMGLLMGQNIAKTYAAGFPLKLMAKDIGIANSLAHAVGVAAPLAGSCAALMASRGQFVGAGGESHRNWKIHCARAAVKRLV